MRHPQKGHDRDKINIILLFVEKPAKIYLVQTVVVTTQKWYLLYIVLL